MISAARDYDIMKTSSARPISMCIAGGRSEMRIPLAVLALMIIASVLLPAANDIVVPDRDRLFSELPVWKDTASYLPERYVYRTADPAGFVIARPANLDRGGNDSHLIVDRFRLQNGSDPSVVASVTLNPGTRRYEYSYAVSNGQGARDAIWSWKLIDEEHDTDIEVELSVWKNGYRVSGMPAGASQVIPGMAKGLVVSWLNVDEPLYPGHELEWFRVSSPFLPGLTSAYFMSGKGIAVTDELQMAVEKQLAPFSRRDVNLKPGVTIGPRYPPSTSQAAWASGFASELRSLITVMPELDHSQFTTNALSFVDACAATRCPQHPDLGKAASPIEKAIREAVVLVLLSH